MPPLSIPHGNLQQIVTAPPVPGIVTGWKPRRSPKPPLSKGGASACRGGGIPQAGRFPHRLVLLESACCESLSRLRRQLPLTREPLGLPDSRKTGFAGTLNDLTIENRMRSPVLASKKRTPITNRIGVLLELLARFELATSSLPRMRSTD